MDDRFTSLDTAEETIIRCRSEEVTPSTEQNTKVENMKETWGREGPTHSGEAPGETMPGVPIPVRGTGRTQGAQPPQREATEQEQRREMAGGPRLGAEASKALSQQPPGCTWIFQEQIGNHVKPCLSGHCHHLLIRAPAPRDFTGSCLCEQLLSRKYKNSRFPEGKQLYKTNHIICTNTVGAVSHSY